MPPEAQNPAGPPHRRRLNEYSYDSSTKAKRSKRVSDDEYLAGCLVALRSGGEASSSPAAAANSPRIYKCSDCGKGVSSHQALGGHKASHRNKPAEKKPSNSTSTATTADDDSIAGPHRLHNCSTCGRSFPSGQALGGHMRKHYGGVIGGSKSGVNSSDGGNGDGFSVVTSSSGGGGTNSSYGDGDVTRNWELNWISEEGLDLTLRL